MVAVTIKVTKPDFRQAHLERDRFLKARRKASYDAADIAIEKARAHVQAKMRAVGLGRLSNAVGFTSAKRKRQTDRTPYGVIFAKGGDESLAGGALESYTRGSTITPLKNWLAVPTKAVPRMVAAGGKRRRLTPALWESAGLNTKIGKLRFRLVNPTLALLVVNRVSLSPKTGQARALGKGKPRTRIVPEKDVVAFVLIKQTRRAKRFDQQDIVGIYSQRVPDYLARLLRSYQREA